MKSCLDKVIVCLWMCLMLLPVCVQAAAEAVAVDPNRQLLHAAHHGSIDGVMIALRMKADIDVRNNKGYTPLMLAVEKAREYAVALLIDQKANVNAESDERKTPLWLAIEIYRMKDMGAYTTAERGNVNIAELLVDAGAHMNNACEYIKNGQRVVRMDALLHAVERGNDVMVRMLLEKKADVNKQNELGFRETALMIATKRCWLDIIPELMFAGVDEQRRDIAHRTFEDYIDIAGPCGSHRNHVIRNKMKEFKEQGGRVQRERGARKKFPIEPVPAPHEMMSINSDDYTPRKEDAAKASVLLKTVVLAGGEVPPSYGEAMEESSSAVTLAMRSAYQLAAQEVRAQGARGGVAQRVVRIQCPACTYDNQEHAHICDMCGTQLQA